MLYQVFLQFFWSKRKSLFQQQANHYILQNSDVFLNIRPLFLLKQAETDSFLSINPNSYYCLFYTTVIIASAFESQFLPLKVLRSDKALIQIYSNICCTLNSTLKAKPFYCSLIEGENDNWEREGLAYCDFFPLSSQLFPGVIRNADMAGSQDQGTRTFVYKRIQCAFICLRINIFIEFKSNSGLFGKQQLPSQKQRIVASYLHNNPSVIRQIRLICTHFTSFLISSKCFSVSIPSSETSSYLFEKIAQCPGLG